MTKKQEINQLVDKYEKACYDYSILKKYKIFAVIFFFIGGFVFFMILNYKKRKLFNQKKEIMRKMDGIYSEIPIEEYLELKQWIVWAGRQ
jgi:hypothetical protein